MAKSSWRFELRHVGFQKHAGLRVFTLNHQHESNTFIYSTLFGRHKSSTFHLIQTDGFIPILLLLRCPKTNAKRFQIASSVASVVPEWRVVLDVRLSTEH